MKNKLQSENHRHVLRFLKLLSKRQKTGLLYKEESNNLILFLNEKQYRFSLDIVAQLKTKKHILMRNNNIIINNSGLTYLKRNLNPDALLASAKNNVVTAEIILNNQREQVQINTNESPLLRLFTRKTKTGSAYISIEEFEAGERLRKDFERGQLQPKISASLQGSIGSSGRSGLGGMGDITDFALDARKRAGKAIDQLGPELSGVTLDICCFLKGLEIVERERAWPPRSAKLMLKTALALLARHYGISGYENNQTRKTHAWGASDYRPETSSVSP